MTNAQEDWTLESEKIDEIKTKKIEIQVNQEKIDYINYAYNKKITYWKKAALEKVSTENEKEKKKWWI